MATQNHIRNPLEWGWDHLKQTSQAVGSAANTMDGAWEDRASAPPTVQRITAADVGDALAKGMRDFGACRTDVIMLCLLYPLAGLVISRLAFDYGMLALVFPLIAGFALIAPLFGLGLYEISRRRERGLETHWTDAFAVARSPNIGSIMVMGLLLLAIFCLWLFAANLLYTVTLGPDAPVSAEAFVRDALTTPQGWTMTVVGIGVGFPLRPPCPGDRRRVSADAARPQCRCRHCDHDLGSRRADEPGTDGDVGLHRGGKPIRRCLAAPDRAGHRAACAGPFDVAPL
jgi:hypothetical protein